MTPTVPSNRRASPVVVGIGEVLFDGFVDREVLGGAPINVAIHADALLGPSGGAGLPVTRVGADDRGERFFREARQRGIDTRYAQTDPARPTGFVRVEVGERDHTTYTFDPKSAWDALAYDESLAGLAGRCDAVTFGTLGQRSETARESIERFLGDATHAIRLFDVNLRQSYYDARVIDRSLRLATAAKMNQGEIGVVARLIGLGEAASVDAWATEIAARYGLDWVALTRGEKGTVLYTDGEKHLGDPARCEPQPGADSVGAGDACGAGLLCGKLLGYSLHGTLTLANRLGAFVASRPGATPTLPEALIEA